MYGGFNYGYNPQQTYNIPVVPPPVIDDGKQAPLSG